MIAYIRHMWRAIVVAHRSYLPPGYTGVRHGGLPNPRRHFLGEKPIIARSTIVRKDAI